MTRSDLFVDPCVADFRGGFAVAYPSVLGLLVGGTVGYKNVAAATRFGLPVGGFHRCPGDGIRSRVITVIIAVVVRGGGGCRDWWRAIIVVVHVEGRRASVRRRRHGHSTTWGVVSHCWRRLRFVLLLQLLRLADHERLQLRPSCWCWHAFVVSGRYRPSIGFLLLLPRVAVGRTGC